MKFFTSDWHHEHKKIVEFTNRGVDTTQERHTEWLVETWNRQVKPGDLVYHLGDWSFSKDYRSILDFTTRLNGQKILIKGNHCREDFLDQLKNDRAISAWYTYKEIMLQGHKVILFHFPISSWHQQSRGSFHLFGHCHGCHKDTKGRMLDVGLDSAYNYTQEHRLFDEDEIVRVMLQQDIYTSDFHRSKGEI